MFRNTSISQRLWFILFACVLALLTISALVSKQNYDSLVNGKKIKTQHLVENTIGVLEHYHQLEKSGALSREQAQQQAKEFIKQLRYDGDDYFFMHDLKPVMVMHPTQPQLDNTDLSSFTDPDGQLIFVEFAKLAREHGGGFFNYLWPKPGSSQPVDKTNFVQLFEPWGWVIGTGVYLDDIQTEFRTALQTTAAIVFGIFVLLAAFLTAIIRSITNPLNQAVMALENIATGEGDLTLQLPEQGRNELSALSRNFNIFNSKLLGIVNQIKHNAHELSNSASELDRAAQNTLSFSNSQMEQTQMIATAINEVSYAVQEVAQNAENASQSVEIANQQADIGQQSIQASLQQIEQLGENMQATVVSMQTLAQQSDEIGTVLDVINDIAEQTNLLALNAAIEAARAGESGRGFAVVADEVRTLAQRSQQATEQIHAIITSLQQQSHTTARTIEQSSATTTQTAEQAHTAEQNFHSINAALQDVSGLNASIASSTLQQSHVVEEINQNVTRVASLSQDTNNSAQESSQACQQLRALAEDLNRILGQFKTG